MNGSCTSPNAIVSDSQGKESVPPKSKPISMHEDVPIWHDCCSCEAEPYWLAVAEELGIDLDAVPDKKKS